MENATLKKALGGNESTDEEQEQKYLGLYESIAIVYKLIHPTILFLSFRPDS